MLDLSPELFALCDISIVQNFVDNPSTEIFKPFFESVMKADAERVKVTIAKPLCDYARRLSLNNLEGEAKKKVGLALELTSSFRGIWGSSALSSYRWSISR